MDSVDPKKNKTKVQPKKSLGYETGNDTLKKWIPLLTNLDQILDLKESSKNHKYLPIKVAYQIPIKIEESKGKKIEIYPYTFEDSLVMENREIFNKITKGTGLLKKMINASNEKNIEESAKQLYEVITTEGAKKAEFALELFYFEEPNILTTPQYIKEGLNWLETKLKTVKGSN